MFDENQPRIDPWRDFGNAVDARMNAASKALRTSAHATSEWVVGRLMTPGELRLVQAMLGPHAAYAQAVVYPRNLWWPYRFRRAMTPAGNIFFPPHQYQTDYSLPHVSVGLRALFLHESTHLYQWYVLQQWVWARGMVDRNYSYKLESGKKLRDYPIEQMAQIVEDFYRLSHGWPPVFPVPYKAQDYRDVLPVRS